MLPNDLAPPPDALFGEDPVAQTSAKLLVTEAAMRLLVRDISFADFVRELLLAVMGAVKSEAGSVLEADHANKILFFRAVVGQSSEGLQKFTIPIHQGIAGHAVESRQPVVVSNAKENQMHLKQVAQAVGFDTRNLVAMPIVIRGNVYGVLELINRLGEDTFTASDLELLEYACGVVAKAIEIRLMLSWAAHRARSGSPNGGGQQGSAA